VWLLGGFTLAVEAAAVFLGQYSGEVNCSDFNARMEQEGLGMERGNPDGVYLASEVAGPLGHLGRLAEAESLLRHALLEARGNNGTWCIPFVHFQLPQLTNLSTKWKPPPIAIRALAGGLALSGQLRPVKGVLSIALEAKRRNRQALIVPIQNAEEAAAGSHNILTFGPISAGKEWHFNSAFRLKTSKL
jgi:hypothetical protein